MSETQQGGNSNLQKQDLSQLDVTKLHPLSPEVISRQATVNVGTIGHVAHGKSTIVKAISGVHTVRFKNELERNITIKLGSVNEIETVPVAEYIPNSYSDHDIEINKSVMSLEIECDSDVFNMKKTNHYKQLTMLDFCNVPKKKLEILEPEPIVPDSNGSSPPSPSPSISSTITSTSQRIRSNVSTPSPVLSISSTLDVESRKRKRDKSSSPAPSIVASKLRKRNSSTNSPSPSPSTSSSVSIKSRKRVSQVKSPSHVQSISSTVTTQSRKTKRSGNKNKSENNYVVEEIVGIDVIGKKIHFEIKWKGYASSTNTWEPLSNLNDCPNLLNNFLTNEMELNKIVIDEIVSQLNADNTIVLSDEEGFEKLKYFDSVSCRSDLILLAKMQENGKTSNKSYSSIYERVKENVALLPFWWRRNEQLKNLEEWQNEINKSDKSSEITVENNVDFETSPSTFKYINDSIAGEGVVIPDDPLIGCDCADGCSIKSNCCGKQWGSKYAYTSGRAIRLAQGNAVFECNKLCKCGPDCTNRVVQQGRKHSLTIFKTLNGRGWGVRTDRVIPQGQYICEYVGEIITNKEANSRGHIYDAERRTYLFDLDCNSIVENKDNLYTIDACKVGNVSRMINHSCDPNIGTWSVWINCLDLDMPQICFYALRRIEAGEELCFDYLNSSVGDVDEKNDDDIESVQKQSNFECKCGSERCRKFIFNTE